MTEPTPATLTEAERESFYGAGDHGTLFCECDDADGYMPEQICEQLQETLGLAERILSARIAEAKAEGAKEVRDQIETMLRQWAGRESIPTIVIQKTITQNGTTP